MNSFQIEKYDHEKLFVYLECKFDLFIRLTIHFSYEQFDLSPFPNWSVSSGGNDHRWKAGFLTPDSTFSSSLVDSKEDIPLLTDGLYELIRQLKQHPTFRLKILSAICGSKRLSAIWNKV
jgi:hypothetical protein